MNTAIGLIGLAVVLLGIAAICCLCVARDEDQPPQQQQ